MTTWARHRLKKIIVAQKTTEAIESLQYPTSVSELQSLLDLCNVYRRFFPNFARLASPLIKNLTKGEPLHYKVDDEERKPVDVRKKNLILTLVLALPQLSDRYISDTDVCDTQVGCILLQDATRAKGEGPKAHWLLVLLFVRCGDKI